MIWKYGLMFGSIVCFVLGFLESGHDGLLWVVMGWLLRIEYIIQYGEEG